MVYIDPIMDKKLDGSTLIYRIDNKDVSIRYHIKGNSLKEVVLNNEKVGVKESINKYRESGISFNKKLLKTNNVLDIYME